MQRDSSEIEVMQARLLRAMASPYRLRIIRLLSGGPCRVYEVSRALGLCQAATSQHLSAMRGVGLVEAVRDGRQVSYHLVDPQVEDACRLMREVLVRRLSRFGQVAANEDLRPASRQEATSLQSATGIES